VPLGDSDVEAEGILDPEIARAPRTQAQVCDHAAHALRDRVRPADVRDRKNDLDGVATFRGPREALEVLVPTHSGGPAPEAQDRVTLPEHQIAVVIAWRFVADDPKAKAAVKTRRQRQVGYV
jgi:hypothetical protein